MEQLRHPVVLFCYIAFLCSCEILPIHPFPQALEGQTGGVQMNRCHDDHTVLRKQLRAASEAADQLYTIQREAALAAEDAARLVKNLAMADAAARKADLIKLLQLDATAHQVAACVPAGLHEQDKSEQCIMCRPFLNCALLHKQGCCEACVNRVMGLHMLPALANIICFCAMEFASHGLIRIAAGKCHFKLDCYAHQLMSPTCSWPWITS